MIHVNALASLVANTIDEISHSKKAQFSFCPGEGLAAPTCDIELFGVCIDVVFFEKLLLEDRQI